MNRYALPVVIVAGTLLLAGCGSASSPVAKDGVATADQMQTIDKVARAMAAEKYSDAFSAGFYTLGSHGGFSQDAGDMADQRKQNEDLWNAVKADFDKGCTLVADRVENTDIISNVVCKGEDKPVYSVGAQYWQDKFAYIGATKN